MAGQPIIQVALPVPVRHLFDYLPAEPGAPLPGAGVRVRVPFGRGQRTGLVAGTRDHSDIPRGRLRPTLEVLDGQALFSPEEMDFLLWAAAYYHWPPGEVLAAGLPGLLRRGRPLPPAPLRWEITDTGRHQMAELRPGARVQREIMAVLIDSSRGAEEDRLRQISPGWKTSAASLRRKGWIRPHLLENSFSQVTVLDPGPELNPEQAAAARTIISGLDHYGASLLEGVTGSGKTEVYLRAMEPVLAADRQVLVLVPEIGLTPQLLERFRTRFGERVTPLHSGMAEGERLRAWQAARTGQAMVIIGTRSAVFTPLRNLGMIIVDEEHDGSLKQQEGFRYSARDLAVVRARRQNIPVILGSATPSLESLGNTIRQRYTHLKLPRRAGAAKPPKVQLVDLRHQPVSNGIATPVMQAMARHLNQGGQVMVYLNRRGYAPTLLCTGCGQLVECDRCDARLVFHRSEQRLVCHHCGARQRVPDTCTDCNGELKPVGQGTERVAEYLSAVFADTPMVRIDRDTTRRRGELEEHLNQVRSGQARLVLGTQMLAKGHDFPELTMVALLDADQGLFGTDFRAAERLAQTFVQVSGRAGRGEAPGHVYLQTLFPDHPLLRSLLDDGYPGFAEAALKERREAGWPPYSHLALLRARAPGRRAVETFLEQAARTFRQLDVSALEILGPAPAPMERRSGQMRAQLLLRSQRRSAIQNALDDSIPRLESLPSARQVRWSLDVDPADLF